VPKHLNGVTSKFLFTDLVSYGTGPSGATNRAFNDTPGHAFRCPFPRYVITDTKPKSGCTTIGWDDFG
jgi:hypothetical protein